MIYNFPNLVKKKKDMQVQEVQKVLRKLNQKRPTPRNIVIKMAMVKDKERLLNAARKRQLLTRKLHKTVR